MKAALALSIVVIILSLAITAYLYPLFPERIVTHWNAQGQPNGFMPKFEGLFLVPFLMAALFLVFLAIPRIDPLKQNIEKFKDRFYNFVLLLLAFMLYLHLLSLLWNLQVPFDFIQAMVPAFAVLFYYAGVLIQHAEKNWFIGIRTPWTLSNEKVWKKTHELGGKLFKASGITCLLGLIFPAIAIWLVIAPIIASAAISIAYSYFEFQKETRLPAQ